MNSADSALWKGPKYSSDSKNSVEPLEPTEQSKTGAGVDVFKSGLRVFTGAPVIINLSLFFCLVIRN
jgi:hypothetical protein